MSAIFCVAVLLPVTGVVTSVQFVLPSDLVDVRNVSLVAQVPEPGMTLFSKDAERPKLWYAPVATDAAGDGVRVWYQRVNTGEKEYVDQRTLCVGLLRDGRWSLPTLSPDPPAWGGPNNVCMRRSPYKPTWGGFNVFQIVHMPDGYRMLYWDQPSEQGLAGGMVATSQDGEHWVGQPGAAFTEHNDAFTLLPNGNEFLLYQTMLEEWPDKPYSDNLDGKRRLISLRRSPDLRAWSAQEVVLRPDAQDPVETEFYLMKVFRYGHAFAGLVMKYYADPAKPGKHSAILRYELVVSEDGRQWQRAFRDTDLGFWSYADPFVLKGRLSFVVWKDGGMSVVDYGEERLTAVEADAEEGSFVTRPFRRGNGECRVNVDAGKGWIEAEWLDASGKPWPRALAVRVAHVEGRRVSLAFVGGAQPAPGEECRMRFRMRNAKVYAVAPGS